MTDLDESLTELSLLPPGHPGRREFERRLAQLPPADRDRYAALAAEYDALRDGTAAVAASFAVPAGLAVGLASAPLAPSSAAAAATAPAAPTAGASFWRRAADALHEPVGWRHVAALLLIGLGLATYLLWPAPGPRPLPVLSEQTVARLADVAGAAKLSPIATPATAAVAAAGENADRDRAQEQLDARAAELNFAPVVLRPDSTEVKLLSFGVCDFGPSKAAFTRWDYQGRQLTLYQVPAAANGLPAQFTTRLCGEATADAQPVPAATSAPCVDVWSTGDGVTAWVLLRGTAPVTNPFRHCCGI
jgi:hypothetical protein